MALRAKINTALDETRMLILGTQVLIGFGYRVVFEEEFPQLPAASWHGPGLLQTTASPPQTPP